MGDQPKKPLWRTVGTFIKDYGQTAFTVGTMIFAAGALQAKVDNISDKTDLIDTTRIQQAQMAVQIEKLTDAQHVQSQSTDKLADAVLELNKSVAKLQGEKEAKRR